MTDELESKIASWEVETQRLLDGMPAMMEQTLEVVGKGVSRDRAVEVTAGSDGMVRSVSIEKELPPRELGSSVREAVNNALADLHQKQQAIRDEYGASVMDIPTPLEFLQQLDPEAAEHLEGVMRSMHEDTQARRAGATPVIAGLEPELDDEDEYQPRDWLRRGQI